MPAHPQAVTGSQPDDLFLRFLDAIPNTPPGERVQWDQDLARQIVTDLHRLSLVRKAMAAYRSALDDGENCGLAEHQAMRLIADALDFPPEGATAA